MLINFEKIKEVTIPRLNNGEGAVGAKMFADVGGKIMISRLPQGASIGEHRHETSSETDYVLQGCCKAVTESGEESLTAGMCHYCPRGSSHSIVNTGDTDLILFTVVSEK